MRFMPMLFLSAIACLSAIPANAAMYDFDVLYYGNGITALDVGSDDPVGTDVLPGDSFSWDIKAQGGDSWTVVTGGDFFPFMAFPVNESGERIGDFTLTLLSGGSTVFTTSEVGADNEFAHLGTNTITLATGLVFDEMHLDYSMTNAIDPDTQLPVDSTINSVLPFFGAPEMNTNYPGIIYGSVVPEPSSLALFGIGLLGLASRIYLRRS